MGQYWLLLDLDARKTMGLGKLGESFFGMADDIFDALFRVQWWRIVLDEAHKIKERTSQAAKACCSLVGYHRWVMSESQSIYGNESDPNLLRRLAGTPIQVLR